MTAQVEKLMKNLGITEAEALQVIEDDKAIDKGKDLFPLTKEQAQVVKACTRADRKPTTKKVERINQKWGIVQALLESMRDLPETADFEVVNAEREFTFTHGGRKFKVTLSAPRS